MTELPILFSGPMVAAVLRDEFNCRSRWSDANPAQCAELEFMVTGAHTLQRAFKVPSLRNVAERAPYMHAGQLATLREVLAHYNRAPAAPAADLAPPARCRRAHPRCPPVSGRARP